MTEYLDQYRCQAQRTMNATMDWHNVALGLIGEIGECADVWKKVQYHGVIVIKDKPWQAHFAEELGDVAWYCAAGATLLLSCGEEGHSRQAFTPKEADSSACILSNFSEMAYWAGAIGYAIARPLGQHIAFHDIAFRLSAILGGVGWLAGAIGMSLETILADNIKKLEARYPEGFPNVPPAA